MSESRADSAIERYKLFLQKVDAFFSAAFEREGSRMKCGSGCDGCCHVHLTLFPIEADQLIAAARKLPEETRQRVIENATGWMQKDAAQCPLLLDRQCALYHSRPLICRSQGLMLYFTGDDGEKAADACPLNFTGGKAVEAASVFDLDQANLVLVSLNADYVGRPSCALPQRIDLVSALATLDQDS